MGFSHRLQDREERLYPRNGHMPRFGASCKLLASGAGGVARGGHEEWRSERPMLQTAGQIE